MLIWTYLLFYSFLFSSIYAGHVFLIKLFSLFLLLMVSSFTPLLFFSYSLTLFLFLFFFTKNLSLSSFIFLHRSIYELVYVYNCLAVYLFVDLCADQCFCLFAFLFACPHICLFVSLSAYPPVDYCSSICLPICTWICLSSWQYASAHNTYLFSYAPFWSSVCGSTWV